MTHTATHTTTATASALKFTNAAEETLHQGATILKRFKGDLEIDRATFDAFIKDGTQAPFIHMMREAGSHLYPMSTHVHNHNQAHSTPDEKNIFGPDSTNKPHFKK